MPTGLGGGQAVVEFDPYSDVFFDDPYETYRRLRDEAPVYHSERWDFYALSRYEDVVAAHRDWETFSSAYGVTLDGLMVRRKLMEVDRMAALVDGLEILRLLRLPRMLEVGRRAAEPKTRADAGVRVGLPGQPCSLASGSRSTIGPGCDRRYQRGQEPALSRGSRVKLPPDNGVTARK